MKPSVQDATHYDTHYDTGWYKVGKPPATIGVSYQTVGKCPR